jgi:pimeloyl-ACP methyl ester carboxylesterase
MEWSFGGKWPYEPHWFQSQDGRMHYVDEGPRDGLPVVMLHGNPTWSFLYRNFIPPLTEAGHRAIAIDHLGFGRSDKPDTPELYTIERHCRRADALLESLDLREATIVPEDWGGPIGLWWATRHPERVRGLFILNTYAHRPPGKVSLPLPLRLFRTPGVGEVMVKGLDLFKRVFLFRAGVVHRERLTAEVKRATARRTRPGRAAPRSSSSPGKYRPGHRARSPTCSPRSSGGWSATSAPSRSGSRGR